MPIEYRYGTPSLEEWHGLWKRDPNDSDVTESEFNGAFRSLQTWLACHGKIGIAEDCDFFVVGDCQGDKTQCVELVKPDVLTLPFLKQLQGWIKESHPNWRIVVPTYLSARNVIIVYGDVIRANGEYEANIGASLEIIRNEMLRLDAYEHARSKRRE
jgi:hypothetical protein